MIAEHGAAVLGLLQAIPNTTTYDGIVPNLPTLPYVALYADQGAAESSDLAESNDWRTWRFQTTCVAETARQARALADRVETALLGVSPAVAGRSCGRIVKDDSQPLVRDDDTSSPYLYAVDRWSFVSVPA